MERTVLSVCANCERFGTALEPGAGPRAVTPGNVGLAMEQRKRRMGGADVYASDSMQLGLVDDFAARIQTARERRGWTRQDLGGRVGERQATIHRIETGTLRPTDEVAKRMEKELGITLYQRIDVVATKPTVSRGLTLGDVLKDAIEKGKKR